MAIAQAVAQRVPRGTLALILGTAHVSIDEKPNAANAATERWATANGL